MDEAGLSFNSLFENVSSVLVRVVSYRGMQKFLVVVECQLSGSLPEMTSDVITDTTVGSHLARSDTTNIT